MARISPDHSATVQQEGVHGLANGRRNRKTSQDRIRSNQWRGVTSGVAPGYVQANLAILPKDLAFDFLLFCQRNPKPCPLLEVIESGDVEPALTTPGADIRTDAAGYRIYENGSFTAEVDTLEGYWRDDLVSFLLGAASPSRPPWWTPVFLCGIKSGGQTWPCTLPTSPPLPPERFSGPMVVSMRPIKREQVVRAVQVTSRFPATHGAPVHIGSPEDIGIQDLYRPDFGDPVEIMPGEEPVFWACGVTPQAVALNCRPAPS